MTKVISLIALTVLLPGVTACNNKTIYLAAQNNLRIECHKGPISQYQECMARTSRSYEEYIRDREEASEQSRQDKKNRQNTKR